MNEKEIARIAYEACREYDKMVHDTFAVPWKDTSQDVKDMCLDLVRDNIAIQSVSGDKSVNILFRAVVLALTNEDSQ